MRERLSAAVDGFGELMSSRICDACLVTLWGGIVAAGIAYGLIMVLI